MWKKCSWIRKDSYRQFKGVWVKKSWLLHKSQLQYKQLHHTWKTKLQNTQSPWKWDSFNFSKILHQNITVRFGWQPSNLQCKTTKESFSQGIKSLSIYLTKIKPNKNYLGLGMFIGWQNHQFNSNRPANLFPWKYLYALHKMLLVNI